MVTVYKFPGTITEGPVSYGRAWSDLANLGADDNTDAYSTSGGIENGARPKTLICTACGYTIPVNSRIDSVKAIWEERATNAAGGSTNLPVFTSRYVALPNAKGGATSSSKTLIASIPYSRATRSLTWTRSELAGVKPEHINSNDFGIQIGFPFNSGNTGIVRFDYVEARVDYTNPTYTLSGGMASTVVVGNTINYVITLTNTNGIHNGYDIPVAITLPSGLEYAGQSGNGTFNPGTGIWNAALSGGRATLTLTLTSTSTGSKTINAEVTGWDVTFNRSTTVLSPSYTLTHELPKYIDEGSNLEFTVTVETDSPSQETVEVTVPVIDGFSFVSSTGDGSYNDGTGIWTASFTDKISSHTFTMQADTPGYYNHTVSVTGDSVLDEILIVSGSVTDPFQQRYDFPTEMLDMMLDGEDYTIHCYGKVSEEYLEYVYPGDRNYRVGVEINGTEYLSDIIDELDVWTWISATFTYNESNPPTILLNGQYLEVTPEDGTFEVAGLMISHGNPQSSYIAPLTLFSDAIQLINADGYSDITLPANTYSTPIRFDTFEWNGWDAAENVIITGLTVTGDIISQDNVSVNITVYNEGNSNSQSRMFTAADNEISIGGVYDKWSFDDIDLNSLYLKLQIMNISGEEQTIELQNLQVTVHYFIDETRGSLGFTYNSIHSRNYGLYLTKPTDPEGPNTKIESLDLSVVDGDVITSKSLNSKTIDIEFIVWGDTLEEAREKLIAINDWLQNPRDNRLVPTPLPLVFDYTPERTYYAILDGNISATPNYASYECKASFLIPKGVAYETEKITGASGTNMGLIHAKPVITVYCTGESQVEIIESVEDQTLTIDYAFDAGTILTIDCENRTITDESGNSYIENVTIDSAWPKLYTGYDLATSTGCLIQTVTYMEGY